MPHEKTIRLTYLVCHNIKSTDMESPVQLEKMLGFTEGLTGDDTIGYSVGF